MATVKSFEDLVVWKDARKYTNKIYLLTKKFPKEEIYGLTLQIRRATISIMSNIAEGFDRYSKKIAKQINGLIKYLRTNEKTFSKK